MCGEEVVVVVWWCGSDVCVGRGRDTDIDTATDTENAQEQST